MPRYLYLLRHAQSAEKQVGQSDKDRELTPTGIKQCIRIANFFLQQKTFPQAILCSSAERTKTTGSLIADALKIDLEALFLHDELYEASTRTLFQFIVDLDNELENVLLVAHNPGISYLAEYLTKTEIGEVVPAGMVLIEFAVASWADVAAGEGKLIQYVDPDKIIL